MLTKNEIFALSLISGVGNKSIQNIIDSEISSSDFDENSLSNLIKGAKKKDAIYNILNNFDNYLDQAELSLINLQNDDIQLISCLDKEYPTYYLQIPNKPVFIYAKGNLELLNHDKNIAVIGTRKCSPFGRDVAFKTAEYFAKNNYNIVSGLALGIDTAAHQGALKAGGLTTAILIDVKNILPKENENLANEILDQDGLLISENPPGTFPQGGLFVSRDRLQSGLSEAVFPIETDIKGGTMHTVRFAEEQGRLLFCPDLASIKDYPRNFAQSNGIKKLINENRAFSYTGKKYNKILDIISNHSENILTNKKTLEKNALELFS